MQTKKKEHENVVISGMCRLQGNDNVVTSKPKHTRCSVLVILQCWKFYTYEGIHDWYTMCGWVRWDGTCRWWCIGQRRWISYTTICMMKSKNDWQWVKWDETPPACMCKTVVCKHKKNKIKNRIYCEVYTNDSPSYTKKKKKLGCITSQ